MTQEYHTLISKLLSRRTAYFLNVLGHVCLVLRYVSTDFEKKKDKKCGIATSTSTVL